MDPENTLGEKLQLEVLLTTRMKSLESDLSDARQALREAQKHEALAKADALALKTSLDASVSLVVRLESDLENHLQSNRGKGEGASATTRHGIVGNMDLSELLGVDMTASTATTTTVVKSDSVAVSTSLSLSNAGQSSNQNQMVNILQAQRDRYKERLSQAESALLSVQQRLSHSETSKAQLEQDNLALYAKIRYLQSVAGTGGPSCSSGSRGYGTKSMSIRSSTTAIRPGVGMTINQFAGILGGGDEERGPRHRGGHDEEERENDDGRGNYEVESRYGALYEQKMNPFAEFSQIEKQRRLQELSVADRIVLNTTMAFVSSHTGRSFLVIYLSLMHMLVFFVIYWNTHHHHHGCDPALDQAISALHRGEAIGAHHSTR